MERLPPSDFSIRFRLDVNPVPKGRPRFGRGRTYTPTETVEFENLVALQFRRQMNAKQIWEPFNAGRFTLFCLFFRKGSAADGDNLIKSVADAAQGIVYDNDKRIVEWHSVVESTTGPGWFEVHLFTKLEYMPPPF